MAENKKRYQAKIINARARLKEGKVIEAYDILGEILTDMEAAWEIKG